MRLSQTERYSLKTNLIYYTTLSGKFPIKRMSTMVRMRKMLVVVTIMREMMVVLRMRRRKT